jgi:cell division protein FtsW (lipid II flippase)
MNNKNKKNEKQSTIKGVLKTVFYSMVTLLLITALPYVAGVMVVSASVISLLAIFALPIMIIAGVVLVIILGNKPSHKINKKVKIQPITVS